MITVPALAAVISLYAMPPAVVEIAPLASPSADQQATEAPVPPPVNAPPPIDAPPQTDIPQPTTPAPETLPPSGDAPEPTTTDDTPTTENEIIVTAGTEALRADPLQEVNLISYQAVQSVDKALVAPVAKTYQRAIPEPIRDGLGNALRNVSEPVNFLNFLLQFKIGKAAETVGRFAINTTLGLGGLFDVAKKKPFHLPHRRNGFANTMGFYGIKPGPYFFLPLLGPTTLRDIAGNSLDLMLLPTAIGAPFDRTAYAIPSNVVMQLNARIERDADIKRLQEESPNPYAETRTLYLEMRQREIDALKAKRPAPSIAPPAAPTAEPATSPEPIPEPAP